MPIFVPVSPRIGSILRLFETRLFESLNRGLLCLRANVVVSFEHLTADVARESLYRLLANVRILSQPQDERVSHILAGGLEVYKKEGSEMPPAHAVPFQEGAARVAWCCSINVRRRVPAYGSYQEFPVDIREMGV